MKRPSALRLFLEARTRGRFVREWEARDATLKRLADKMPGCVLSSPGPGKRGAALQQEKQ